MKIKMTLQRQLLLMLFILFVLVLIGTFTISTVMTRQYLEQQLRSHARDAATSLGLLLSPPMAKGDRATMISIIDAVYDRGYYQTIRLEDMDGKVLVNRIAPLKVARVPQWFVDLIPLEPPQSESLVMDGWQQAGRVIVRSHPGYAYLELWQSLVGYLIWFVIVFAIGLVLGSLVIHYLLIPLRAIGAQAQAIIEGRFPVIEKLPRTVQLRRVAVVMNRMSKKLESVFEAQRHVAAQLRKRVYQDPVTGLENRVAFMNHLAHEVTQSDDPLTGALLLIEIDGVHEFNQVHGMAAGDALMKRVAGLLQNHLTGLRSVFLAKLVGSRFGLLHLHCKPKTVADFAQAIADDLASLSNEATGDAVALSAHIGLVNCQQGAKGSELIASAEVALAQARASGDFNIDQEAFDPEHLTTEATWKEALGTLIEQQAFTLMFQPAFIWPNREVYCYEVLFKGNDPLVQPHRAREIFAMAEMIGRAHELDKTLLEAAFTHLRRTKKQNVRYALNISMGALQHPSFIPWLLSSLKSLGKLSQRLIFEVSEFTVVHNLEVLTDLMHAVERTGARLSIDQFGRASSAFAYLRTAPIDYVKIDGTYIRNLDQNPDNQFYVQSLINVAHSVELPVIADKVRTPEELATLERMHIDGVQGRLLAEPSTKIAE